MLFEVVRYRDTSRRSRFPIVVLTRNAWDDYGWQTMFDVEFFDEFGQSRPLGAVKVLKRGVRQTLLPSSFTLLDDDHCSAGTSAEYYRALSRLERNVSEAILSALRDVAVNTSIREAFETDAGFEASLIRFSETREALEEGARLFGGARTTNRDELLFTFHTALSGFDAPHEIKLKFNRTTPLGRTAAIIGKNGTGKTRLLARLAHGLVGLLNRRTERLEPAPVLSGGVIAMSWSAFDRFQVPRGELPVRYSYVGLRRFEDTNAIDPALVSERVEPPDTRYERLDLGHAVARAGRALLRLDDSVRWHLCRALERIDTCPVDKCRAIGNAQSVELFERELATLSSGQQLIVFTLVHMFADLKPDTVVLFDEPEAHLHPALLTGLLRELHDLLDARDSFAILATHNPLVLQELPASRVVILDNVDGTPATRAYPGESFGELLSILMESAFGVGGEDRNWRLVLRRYQEAGQLDKLREGLNEALNLPLAGLIPPQE